MSKSKKKVSKASAVSGALNTKEEKAFERARAKGEVTDIMGNPMGDDEFIEIDPNWNKHEFVYGVVVPQLKHLQGRLLTILDASFEDKERAKFVKDLMRDAISQEADTLLTMAIG